MDETLKGLLEERAGLVAKADQIVAEATKREAKRLSGEEEQEFDRIYKDVEKLTGDIDRRSKHEEVQRALAASKVEKTETAPGELSDAQRSQAFKTWCRVGSSMAPTEAELTLARQAGFAPGQSEIRMDLPETRAMGVGEATKGQKAVPQSFINALEVARLAHGDVRSVARVVRTTGGNPLKFPTSNDTGNTGRLLGENTQVTAGDIVISELELGAYKYSSDLVLVSVELLQDESVDLEAHIASMLGERLGRITNTHFTTGAGSTLPLGVVTASTLGKLAAGDDVVTYGELVDLMHSVDPAYQAGARWMFNFSTLAALKKMVDAELRPLWQPAMSSGIGGDFPGTLLGKPYTVNQQMPSMAVDAKAVLYGDFSKYLIREVKDIQLLRLNERYADYHQVAFLAYLRTDGDLLNAGTNPIKHLRMAGS